MSAVAYTHSETFDQLKRTVERVDDNLTSAQYLNTLDYFLWNAITPIAKACPAFTANFFSKSVAQQALRPNSKFTSDDKDTLQIKLFNALLAYERGQKTEFLEALKKLRMNRGILFGFVFKFLRETKEYKEHQSAFNSSAKEDWALKNKMYKIEYALGVEGTSLYSVIQIVEFWEAKARDWKDVIVEKYTAMSMKAAQKTYVDYNHVVPLDDVTQIYLMTTSKAVDRCDSRLGVLTIFIQRWHKSAKAQVGLLAANRHEESFEELSESGDTELAYESPDASFEAVQHISYKAKLADPVGIVRTALGIPQFVSSKSRNILSSFVLEA